jgi:glycosyltransferase involved in cell wall biosynthesis
MQIEQNKAGPEAGGCTVSCLMVTLPVPERLAFAKRSIDDFCRQTLARKNLVVVLSGGVESVRQALREYVESLGRDDIRVFTQPPDWNLGQLRNFTLEVATGDVLCHWDDDDLYHPERLARQLVALQEGDFEAVYLQEVMQYFPASKVLYWTSWRATEAGGHTATMMVRREAPIRYSTEGSTARLGEDLEVARMLVARGRVGYVAAKPHLYVYVSHGANSWDEGHHRMLAEKLSISQGLLRRREAQVREGMAAHGFGRDTVTVTGNNGEAFRL